MPAGPCGLLDPLSPPIHHLTLLTPTAVLITPASRGSFPHTLDFSTFTEIYERISVAFADEEIRTQRAVRINQNCF